MSRGRKVLRVLDRRSFGIGLAVSVGALAADSVGVVANWWDWPPDRLLATWINLTLTMTVLWVLNGKIGPVVEAYRLGMAAGRREQRRECATRCGHECGEPTAEMRMGHAVGQAAVPPSAGGAHPQGRRSLHVVK